MSRHRSVLSTKAEEAEPLKPGKVWDEHSVLLLEGGEALPDKLVSEIQQEVKKVCLIALFSHHFCRPTGYSCRNRQLLNITSGPVSAILTCLKVAVDISTACNMLEHVLADKKHQA